MNDDDGKTVPEILREAPLEELQAAIRERF